MRRSFEGGKKRGKRVSKIKNDVFLSQLRCILRLQKRKEECPQILMGTVGAATTFFGRSALFCHVLLYSICWLVKKESLLVARKAMLHGTC